MTKEHFNCNFIYNSIDLEEDDDNMIATEFVYYLDKKISGWGIKCYIAERDCLGGSNIFDELFKIVSDTKKCLVIITPEFRSNYWAKYCNQAAFKYLLEKKNQHKMVPITLNIKDIGSLKELNVNSPFHMKGSNEEQWENNNNICMKRLKKTLTEEKPNVAEEEGDNRLHTERQHLLVTEPSSAIADPPNSPFFTAGQGSQGPQTIQGPLQDNSYLSIDGPTSLKSSSNDTLQHRNFPQTEANGRVEEVSQQLTDRPDLRLNIDTIDGLAQINTDQSTDLDFGDLSIDHAYSCFETPRPETIGGSGSLNDRNEASSFLEVISAPGDTALKQPNSSENIHEETYLKQPYPRENSPDSPADTGHEPMSFDSGYTTPSVSVTHTPDSGIHDEHQSHNLTNDQIQTTNHQDANQDSSSGLGEATSASLSDVVKANPYRVVGMVGRFLSFTVDSIRNADKVFK